MRRCVFALFLVRFCGNFHSYSRYCGLQLLQPLDSGFLWKKNVFAVMTLFKTVGIRLLCKREPSVSFYNASTFIISIPWFAIRRTEKDGDARGSLGKSTKRRKHCSCRGTNVNFKYSFKQCPLNASWGAVIIKKMGAQDSQIPQLPKGR